MAEKFTIPDELVSQSEAIVVMRSKSRELAFAVYDGMSEENFLRLCRELRHAVMEMK